jgi:Tol biopolymer transport system component/DNA-binding winged helix-turn-helix (wHTH) protein
MVGSSTVGDKVRFGPFEADLRSGELRKLGIRIKLQGQPFRVLCLLIEHKGEVVSREELQREIWGPTTVVDFDRGLGTAINKVREALCDSADSPRYIETLARRGYRFIADVQAVEPPRAPEPQIPQQGHDPVLMEVVPQPVPVVTLQSSPAVTLAEDPATNSRGRRKWLVSSLAVITACAWALGFWSARSPIVQFKQVTWSEHVYPGDSALERFPGVVTDGLNVFFPEMRDRNLLLSSASIRDGDASPVSMPADIIRPSVADISPDGTRLLVLSMTWAEPEHPLWVVPSHGGAAHKVSNALAHDATWLPDGESILFAAGHDLVITRSDGSAHQKLATLSGRAFWLRYSPDGKTLRFTMRDPKTRAGILWEIAADGSGLHRLLAGWDAAQNECCGSWTADGDFIFQATSGSMSNIWIRHEQGRRFSPDSMRIEQLTSGPLSYVSPVPDRHGRAVLVIGTHSRNQLLRFDPASRQFSPATVGTNNANRIVFTREGTRVAWTSSIDGTLWQSLSNGPQRLQLTSGPMRVSLMNWSPDNRRLAFAARKPGGPQRIYLVAADGGTPEEISAEAHGQTDPSWSPDGNSIVFGRSPQYLGEDTVPKALYVIDLKTRKRVTLPGSEGLFSPRWSPNGRYIAAISLNQRRMVIFDRTTETWREVASQSINNPTWSRAGDAIYFQSSDMEDQPIYKVTISTGRVQAVVDFRDFRQADKVNYLGLAPDDSPLVSLRFATADIYSLTRD